MPILLEDTFHYTLADREFYEPLDRYRPNDDDYLAVAKRHLPPEWGVMRHGIWYNCFPPNATVPAQGWKIHVSATSGNSPSVLATVARVARNHNAPFKFAIDNFVFRLLNGKNWPRGGSGKFITLYPSSVQHCQELLDVLRGAMLGYNGPYILSDRRYRDSRTVHYRYGGIAPTKRLCPSGEQRAVILGTSGEVLDDDRTPFFQMPHGVRDPFRDEAEDVADNSTGVLLNNGRYQITSAITFSNSGGVYLGLDKLTGQKVVIKEARPYTSQNQGGTDAVWLLKKEYRLLSLIGDLQVAPQAIDFFQEWEHFYLVEEFIEGQILRGYNAKWALALNVAPTQSDSDEYLRRYRQLYFRLAEIIAALHSRNIVFSDLSHYNVIVQDDGADIKLIDFEGAYEQGVDAPTLLYTPGFAPKQVYQDGSSEYRDDYYGLGGLMLAAVWPINSILALDSQAAEPFLASAVRDLAFPEPIAEVISGLLVPERELRTTTLDDVRRALAQESPSRVPAIAASEVDECALPEVLGRMVDYLDAVVDWGRDDRLYPSAPIAFQTNPLSIAYGAAGVAHTLYRIRGSVDDATRDWLRRHPVEAHAVPPGLQVGSGGVAWALLEIGMEDLAHDAILQSSAHELRFESPDYFEGAAGWGMAQLRFFLHSGDSSFLDRARAAGEHLSTTCQQSADGAYWLRDGIEYAGLGHGGAGIALFLLYLSMATGDERYRTLGHSAMNRVVARGIATPADGLTWRVQEGHPTITPYWRWGSAGIGMVLLRFNEVLEDRPFDPILQQVLNDTDRKYSIFPGQHLGLVGIGEFLLDLAATASPLAVRARAAARKVLAGALLFRICRPVGIAFPGESRTRIACDFATGSAGIASFIHRFLTNAPQPFLLDDLLRPNGALMQPFADRHRGT